MKLKKLKPMTVRDVEDMITVMSETADILSLPQEWLEAHINSRAMMQGRDVTIDTIRDAIEFWRQDYLDALRWSEIERRTVACPVYVADEGRTVIDMTQAVTP